MLRITDGKSQGRLALDADVQLGTTFQSEGAPLPLMLTSQAAQDGRYLIYRDPVRRTISGLGLRIRLTNAASSLCFYASEAIVFQVIQNTNLAAT